MAQFQRHFVQDLTKPLIVRQCGDLGFSGDNLSDVISVDLYTDGVAYSGGGTCAGACICPDGSTVALTGSVSGKTASVTLKEDCFAIPGQIGIGIRITTGTTKTTVLKCIYNVDLFATNNPVDPGSRITLDVGDLVNRIDAATADIPASDMASLMAGIAPTFSATTAYPAGAYVYYNGTLYRFAVAHAAGSWTGTDVVQVALGNDVADLKSAFDYVANNENNVALEFSVEGSGHVNATTGEIGTTAIYSHTGLIPVGAFDSIAYRRLGVTAAYSTAGIAFYNSNGGFIPESGVLPVGSQSALKYMPNLHTVSVPSGAAYVRCSTIADTTTAGNFEIYGLIDADIVNQVKGISNKADAAVAVTELAATVSFTPEAGSIVYPSVWIEATQASGTPSPSNILAVTGKTSVTVTYGASGNTDTETIDVSTPAGGAVYKGYIDYKNKKLVVTHKYLAFDGTEEWTSQSTTNKIVSTYLSDAVPDFATLRNSSVCTGFVWIDGIFGHTNTGKFTIDALKNAYFCYDGIDGVSDAASWKSWLASKSSTPIAIVYPLATSLQYDITLEDIVAVSGVNVVSGNTGDAQVEYHLDLSTFVSDYDAMNGDAFKRCRYLTLTFDNGTQPDGLYLIGTNDLRTFDLIAKKGIYKAQKMHTITGGTSKVNCVRDPAVIRIGDEYYITYTIIGYDTGCNEIGICKTKDFSHFEELNNLSVTHASNTYDYIWAPNFFRWENKVYIVSTAHIANVGYRTNVAEYHPDTHTLDTGFEIDAGDFTGSMGIDYHLYHCNGYFYAIGQGGTTLKCATINGTYDRITRDIPEGYEAAYVVRMDNNKYRTYVQELNATFNRMNMCYYDSDDLESDPGSVTTVAYTAEANAYITTLGQAFNSKAYHWTMVDFSNANGNNNNFVD